MPTPTRIRLARYICDIVAIGVGTYCALDMLLSVKHGFNYDSPAILCPIMSLFGIVGGLGYGFTESAKPRRFFNAAFIAMCAMHIVLQAFAFKFGVYARLAPTLFLISIPCILSLLCVVANQLISRRIERPTNLPLKKRFFRLIAGIMVAWQVMSIAGAVAHLHNATSLAWMLIWMFGMVNFALRLGAYGIAFWYRTPDRMPPAQIIVVGKLFMAIVACLVISTLSRHMHAWQSLPDAMAIVVLAGCVLFVIAKHRVTIKEEPSTSDALAIPA